MGRSALREGVTYLKCKNTMTNTPYQHYKIFISSPYDVKEERRIADEVINKINDVLGDFLHIHLQCVTADKMPPATPEDGIQEMINRKIKECQFFLLILYKRYGTVEKGYKISNTEREVNAIFSCEEKKRILSYFKTIEPDNDPGKQERKVKELRKRLGEDKRVFYKEFSTPEEFRDLLTHGLYEVLLRIHLSPTKVEHLKSFWRFGKDDSRVIPKTLIIYPPLKRSWMAADGEDYFWHRRFLPNIFAEDFEAISIISRMLNLIGLKQYKVITNSSYGDSSSDNNNANLIWICVPRQNKALNTLSEKYKEKRFTIFPRGKNGEPEPYLEWKDASGNPITVHSPLKKYLQKQRTTTKGKKEWDPAMSKIFAKDYAIIARYNRKTPFNNSISGELIKEYFIAGIRGLGTWGAAWYLDRSYMEYDFEQNQTVEMLLEVIYENGKIVEVKDVSSQDQDYFELENSDEMICDLIEESKKNSQN